MTFSWSRLVLTLALCPFLLSSCEENEQGDKTQTGREFAPAPKAQTLGDAAYKHCAALCDIGPRPTGSANYQKQLQYLQSHLDAAGWTVMRRNFDASGSPMCNLYARWGNKEGTRPLMLSCHIDTKQGVHPDFVGADDGASGAAVLLVLARELAKKPEYAEQIELVFLDGEESFGWHMTVNDGLYGSKWDARRRQREKDMPRWQINLDMVGGKGMTIAPPAMDTNNEMYGHYSNAVRALGFSPERWAMVPNSYLDDHRPYLELGVSSLNLICHFTQGSWWHTVRDNMERICPNSLDQSCRMVLQLVEQILTPAAK